MLQILFQKCEKDDMYYIVITKTCICFHSPNHSNLTDFQAKRSTSKDSFEPKCKRRMKKISQEVSGPSPSDENGENDGSKISLQNF